MINKNYNKISCTSLSIVDFEILKNLSSVIESSDQMNINQPPKT